MRMNKNYEKIINAEREYNLRLKYTRCAVTKRGASMDQEVDQEESVQGLSAQEESSGSRRRITGLPLNTSSKKIRRTNSLKSKREIQPMVREAEAEALYWSANSDEAGSEPEEEAALAAYLSDCNRTKQARKRVLLAGYQMRLQKLCLAQKNKFLQRVSVLRAAAEAEEKSKAEKLTEETGGLAERRRLSEKLTEETGGNIPDDAEEEIRPAIRFPSSLRESFPASPL